MKRKMFLTLLIMLCLFLSLAFASCSDDETDSLNGDAPHEHSYGDWAIVKEPTCTEQGKKQKTCSVCQEIKQKAIAALGHDYENTDWETVTKPTCTEQGKMQKKCSICQEIQQKTIDALGHDYENADWETVKEPTCTQKGEKQKQCANCREAITGEIEAKKHNYVSGYCTECGERNESEGLAFELSDDGTYYSVVGIGVCADNEVVIPNEYCGLPVKEINELAFVNCENITKIDIPSSLIAIGDSAFAHCYDLEISFEDNSQLKSIGAGAFFYCAGLKNVVLPDSVTSIGDHAFGLCGSLRSIELGDGITSIGELAFDFCSSLTSITLPSGVTSIGDKAFYGCLSMTSVNVDEDNENYKSVEGTLYTKDGKALIQYALGKEETSFVIPDSVTSICEYAFYSCENLTSVVIPSSVTSICKYAFDWCSNLTIYCEAEGQPDGWNSEWNSFDCPVEWGYTEGE